MRFFCSLFFSLWMSVVLGLSVEKTVCPSSTELLLLPCEQSSGHVVWACFWAFRCVPLACVAPLLPGSLHADGSSCIEDGTAKRVLPPMFQDCLSYSRICAFPIILEEAFLCLLKKKTCCDFDRICIKPCISSGRIDMSLILSFPINEHVMSSFIYVVFDCFHQCFALIDRHALYMFCYLYT